MILIHVCLYMSTITASQWKLNFGAVRSHLSAKDSVWSVIDLTALYPFSYQIIFFFSFILYILTLSVSETVLDG